MNVKKSFYITFGIIAVILIIFLSNTLNQSGQVKNQSLLATDAHFTVNQTLQAERRLILQLTTEPNSAEFMTPFYAEILFNEAVRFATVTPTLDPIESTPECWLYADFWQQRNLANTIVDTLASLDIEVVSEAFVSVIWNTNTCSEYIPVSNRIRVWVTNDSPPNSEEVQMILKTILEIIRLNELDLSDISSVWANVEISVIYDMETPLVYLVTNLQTISQLSQEGLESSDFVDALGGFQTRE